MDREDVTPVPRLKRLMALGLDPGPVASWLLPAKIAGGLLLLVGRLWLGWAFLSSGLTRVTNWGSQAFLFSSVHPVPFLPPDIAALVTTTAELLLPCALIIGLLTRPAAFGLAVMAATIYFVIGQTPEGIENGIAIASEQFPWMAVGVTVAAMGAGPFSLDAFVKRRLQSRF